MSALNPLRSRLFWAIVSAALAPPAYAQEPPIQLRGLDFGRCSSMHMRLEKTLLKIDVLSVSLRFGKKTTQRLRNFAANQPYSEELADAVAQTAYRAEQAYVRVLFRRDISLQDFISAVRENLRKARAANMISLRNYWHVSRNLPNWFAFLEERGIRQGDQLLYRVRPNSLRTVFVDHEGEERFDQIDRGQAPRLALLGGYFAPESDFREGLVRSLCR